MATFTVSKLAIYLYKRCTHYTDSINHYLYTDRKGTKMRKVRYARDTRIKKVRYARDTARDTRIKKVRYARITRIQHDNFLPENRNTHTPTPRATRARVEIYQNRKGLVNIMAIINSVATLSFFVMGSYRRL